MPSVADIKARAASVAGSAVGAVKSIDFKDASKPWPFIGTYAATAIAAVIVPVLQWNSAKNDYYKLYGYYIEYEQQQRAYEEEQNGDDKNDNDDGNQNYYYKECSWWNWSCRKQQWYYASMDEDGDGDEAPMNIPNWYIFLGGADDTEQMRRWKEENTGMRAEEMEQQNNGVLWVVYAFMLVAFLAMVGYGIHSLYNRRPYGGLIAALLIYSHFCLVELLLVPQGVISSDDRDMENSIYGWYGQTGVLMVYSAMWFLIHSVGFAVAIAVRAFVEGRRSSGDSEAESHYRRSEDFEPAEESTKEGGDSDKYSAPKLELA
eukprot:CAMPEP_0183294622 /NCGR_PEP_ID=MMETSP0160_2-20130417/2888_1 /TAXON_ID=2839 ORGANISM="Odontella Sinensis, Strain Grunow 1884" /NCGR_SAMPLE_ID=MMETSP0160_2 /ASSEMBLY_ACC=CAM_ASM_000250 /LENGTH=317 /DNA_ID=CAMNT_0025455973 /DNA_START=57 /DNA_END=1010 /DNA_ORIENTATION=-